jgi:ATP/maltotriose-dependent transcriptional regulator MalT
MKASCALCISGASLGRPKRNLAAIFTKLGVTTRAEAVGAAYRLGVMAADSDRPAV